VYLDLRTMQVAAIVVCCVLGPVSLAFTPNQRYMQPSRFWGAGLIALAGGLALVILGGQGPAFTSQVLGPGLLALALTFAQSSARSVVGKGGRDILGLTLLALYILMLLAQQMLAAEAWPRDALGLGMLGALACRAAYGFDRGKGLPEGRSLRLIGIIFGLFGVSLLLQGALAVSVSNTASTPGVADALMLVGLIAGLLLGTMLLMWVMTERINSRMRQLVTVDPLSGALNRPAFVEQFEREASRSRRMSDAQFAILLIDIDHFRRINDTSGHAAGDRLLEKTIEVLRGMTRDYDVIGRLEGDVFVLLTPGVRGDSAMSLAERGRREIELKASARAGLTNRVTVSIGVAVFGEHGDSWDTMLRAADSALQYAKKLGGNGVEAAVAMPHSSSAAFDAAATKAGTDQGSAPRPGQPHKAGR